MVVFHSFDKSERFWMGNKMNEKIKNFLAGVISLIILAAIATLYFSSILDIDNTAVAYFNQPQQPIQNSSCYFQLPKDSTIILRMDDVQEIFVENVSYNITKTIFDKNFSVTWGLIPSRINKNIQNFVAENENNPNFEVAQHGTYHTVNEYQNLTENETYNLMKIGYDIIVKKIGIIPVTFIPPHNEFNNYTISTAAKFGFKLFSGKESVLKNYGDIFDLGYTVDVKSEKTKELIPAEDVVQTCSKSLNLTNACVILFHPQDYSSSDFRNVDEKKYKIFADMLDGLKQLQAKTSTFEGLLTC